MTLTELRYIVTLAQERHFGKAAERCFVSQPTLSVAVKKLEKELGVSLFERSKTAMTVTPLGEQIVNQAQKVLEEAALLKQIASQGKDQLASPLRVGSIYTVGPYLLPDLIPRVKDLAPKMPLYIEENFTAVLRKQLRDGELDAIIVALPFTEPDVVCQPLFEEDLHVLLPVNHPWAKSSDPIDPSQLAEEDLLLLGEGHCFRDLVLQLCPQLHERMSQQKGIVEGSSLETLRHMVASGMGITVLPESATGMDHYTQGMLTTRPFTHPTPKRTVALAWRVSFPRPKAIDILSLASREKKNPLQLRA